MTCRLNNTIIVQTAGFTSSKPQSPQKTIALKTNKMKTSIVTIALVSFMITVSQLDLDDILSSLIIQHKLTPMEKPVVNKMKAELGEKLFFDKILSGNKDISCATCHHPAFNSADGLVLPIGVGGEGLGSHREIGYDRTHVPRNSPEIFNRGAEEWHTMFWDSRVNTLNGEEFDTPAEEKLPHGLDNILAVQAMFPVTSRDEMRGEIGDVDVLGEVNELALISNAAPQSIWNAIMERILNIPEYVELFRQVYPDIATNELGFQHAANAIAAFEIDAFTYLNSPWDRFLEGDEYALTELQKEGAVLFYGKAGCVQCHSGNLMTDQLHHNIGIPQFGPGKGNAAPLDVGRFLETGEFTDRFAFRTPPLRNVAATAPYMHNGAYAKLEDAIMHHFNPVQSLKNYNKDLIPEELRETFQDDENVRKKILETIDPILYQLTYQPVQSDIDAIVAFLEALTDEGLKYAKNSVIFEVPSGLPVDKLK